eukprot:CAMPEP_0197843586 /NCGR_PEP_ID=MMETSP1438-20131217/467_1 /TAXON_ID=1461541 /ORGANISM="Pterosperma sp., Strain CCMP1384" /LENGTH=206 /DNA_ID=CAMNT_0043453815 /DNA_START=498 /DNA_END=1118 /DNA_ORIENTATION=+
MGQTQSDTNDSTTNTGSFVFLEDEHGGLSATSYVRLPNAIADLLEGSERTQAEQFIADSLHTNQEVRTLTATVERLQEGLAMEHAKREESEASVISMAHDLELEQRAHAETRQKCVDIEYRLEQAEAKNKERSQRCIDIEYRLEQAEAKNKELSLYFQGVLEAERLASMERFQRLEAALAQHGRLGQVGLGGCMRCPHHCPALVPC